MRYMKHLLIVFPVLGIIACSSSNVAVDYDREVNFANYKTFNWAPEFAWDLKQGASFLDKRVRNNVENQLTAKGFRLVDEQADFLIAYHTGVQQKVDVMRYGFRGRRVAVRPYKEGTLVIDFIDAKTKDLLWRGTSKDVLTGPETAEETVREAVAEMMEQFPPKP